MEVLDNNEKELLRFEREGSPRKPKKDRDNHELDLVDILRGEGNHQGES